MKTIPYGRQKITEEDISAVVAVLKSDFLTQGPKIAEFEKAFAAYADAKYAVAVSNGTAALHLCALALNVNQKSNVITTPITFAASSNCIRYCGGNIWFSDIDSATYTLDIDKVESLIKSKPKGFFSGIIPVDFAGSPVNLEAFKELSIEHNLWILEDACHAPGGYFIDSKNQKQKCGNGNFADLAIFSFHPVKHIACGEGGMITTNDKSLYEKLLVLRTHGITRKFESGRNIDGGWYYDMVDLGYNYRLTDFQAALGLSQLSRADDGLNRRKEIAKKYYNTFKDVGAIKGQSGFVEGHAYHLYVIEVDERKALYDYLRQKGINCQIHYIPTHTLSYYKKLGWQPGDLPVAEKYYSRCLSLPMYHSLNEEEQNYVINQIINFYSNE